MRGRTACMRADDRIVAGGAGVCSEAVERYGTMEEERGLVWAGLGRDDARDARERWRWESSVTR